MRKSKNILRHGRGYEEMAIYSLALDEFISQEKGLNAHLQTDKTIIKAVFPKRKYKRFAGALKRRYPFVIMESSKAMSDHDLIAFKTN